jgi:rSAM/selenodomain-associated transferase 1
MVQEKSDDPGAGRTDVVVMAKPALAGRVKTRLADEIGESQATDLYARFLQDIARHVDDFLKASGDGDDTRRGVLAHTGDPSQPGYETFLDRGFDHMHQGDGGLGARLRRVTASAFDGGADRVLVIGTDSPTLSRRHLEAARRTLCEPSTDVVVGPAFDGGYYLIGLDAPAASPFAEINWSSTSVLKQTLRRCRANDLVCELLEFWYDVDTVSDLQFLRDHLLEYLTRRTSDTAAETTRWLNDNEASWSVDS